MSLENEKNILFKKKYKCPICENPFESLCVKAGKTRRAGQGNYLRPIFEGVTPIKYDAIMCPKCGYSAMARYFNETSPAQRLMIRENVVSMFQPVTFNEDAYTYDEAMKRYKMAFLCDLKGNVAESRIAYTCVKLAWLVRARIEDPEEAMSEEEIASLEAYEMECVKNSFAHYMNAFAKENFPMCGMDEYTVSYLVAELAYGLDKISEAQQMLSNVVGQRDITPRLKDKAYDLKEAIRKRSEQLAKEKEENK